MPKKPQARASRPKSRRARGPRDANGLPIEPHPKQVKLPFGERTERKRYPTTEGVALLAKVMTKLGLTATRVDLRIGKKHYTYALLDRTRNAPSSATMAIFQDKLGIPADAWGRLYAGPEVTFPQYKRCKVL